MEQREGELCEGGRACWERGQARCRRVGVMQLIHCDEVLGGVVCFERVTCIVTPVRCGVLLGPHARLAAGELMHTTGVGGFLSCESLPHLDNDTLDGKLIGEADVAAAVVDPLHVGWVVR